MYLGLNNFTHRTRLLRKLLAAKPLLSGLLGITLLMPATFFLLTLLVRVCTGSTGLYYSMAPSFLQTPSGISELFALHKAQVILGGVLGALLINLLTVLRLQLHRGRRGWEVLVSWRRYWFNTAIAVQSSLLFLILVAYTLIQHIRY